MKNERKAFYILFSVTFLRTVNRKKLIKVIQQPAGFCQLNEVISLGRIAVDLRIVFN
uniref:Uncharacterized protein n=1 Tax=Octopus bimaculoides TaxID=37653 RepID=A0A0L8HWW7_OCTBM